MDERHEDVTRDTRTTAAHMCGHGERGATKMKMMSTDVPFTSLMSQVIARNPEHLAKLIDQTKVTHRSDLSYSN